MTKSENALSRLNHVGSFGLRHSLVIRHYGLVIFHFLVIRTASFVIFSAVLLAGTIPAPASGVRVRDLVMVAGALVFILVIPTTYAVQLQLLGGMWIIQTFPAIVFSVFTRFFNGWALLAGWAVGIVSATWLVALNHFAGSIWAFHVLGFTLPSYIALATVVLNALVAAVLSLPLNAFASDRAGDETRAEDYI